MSQANKKNLQVHVYSKSIIFTYKINIFYINKKKQLWNFSKPELVCMKIYLFVGPKKLKPQASSLSQSPVLVFW